MYWRSLNCDRCAFDCPVDEDGNFGEPLCVMEEAISLAAIGDGMIHEELAARAGLPFTGISKCHEFDPIPLSGD